MAQLKAFLLSTARHAPCRLATIPDGGTVNVGYLRAVIGARWNQVTPCARACPTGRRGQEAEVHRSARVEGHSVRSGPEADLDLSAAGVSLQLQLQPVSRRTVSGFVLQACNAAVYPPLVPTHCDTACSNGAGGAQRKNINFQVCRQEGAPRETARSQPAAADTGQG